MAKKGTKKSAKATSPDKLSPAEEKYAAFRALWKTYLHLRVWGLPLYEELEPDDKEYFRELIGKGTSALFAHIEDCKRWALRTGLGDQVRDEWLLTMELHDFDLVRGFPQAKRDYLGKMIDDMWPLMVRLDPNAIPPANPARGTDEGKVPDDLITTVIAVGEYHVSAATIRRKIKAGELRDYRPPNPPRTSKLLLSRAEIGRLFPPRK